MKTNSIIILLLALLISISACVKKPDKLHTPSLKLNAAIRDNKEIYILKLSSGIENKNAGTAFTDLKGKISIIDPENESIEPVILPFEIPIILPFDIGIINIEKELPEKDIMRIIDILNINKEKFISAKGIDGRYIDEKNLDLDIISYQKEDILDILNDKIK